MLAAVLLAAIEIHSGAKPIAVVDQFVETWPGNNTAAKVRTVAKLSYDDKYLYVEVQCDDPQPSQIRAAFGDRDSIATSDDFVAIYLDTRNDRRSAIELRVNPRGIQSDAIYNDANGNEDFSPDFFFDSAAHIGPDGWSAELRIPFSSLRYRDAPSQEWGILISRNYPRDFQYTLSSAPSPRESTCLICHAQTISGLAGLPKSGHEVIVPYATSHKAGGDVKWSPTADHTIDFTLNPDFSQIESDVPQITGNQRFAVFYPEKRPFFLEGFDLFDTPIPVAWTRTITSPRWGLRATGKAGSTAYTILAASDRGGGLTIIPGPTTSTFVPQDFRSSAVIARVRHDAGSSFVGAVLTDRRGGPSPNRVFGPDFQWRPSNNDALTGQFLYSSSGSRSHSFAGVADYAHQFESFDYEARVRNIGSDFRADNGFVPQVGYRELELNFGARQFPSHGLFNFVRTYFWGDIQTDQRGATIFQKAYPGIYVEGKKRLIAGFSIRPAEKYRVGDKLLQQSYVSWSVQFDPSRRVPRVLFSGRTGESIDFINGRAGHGTTLTAETTLRPIDRLTIDVHGDRQWLNVRGARVFAADIERLKVTYSFNDRSLVRAIVQNDALWSESLLYSFKWNWQTLFFAGYERQRTNSVFVKISYAFQR